MTTTGAYRSYFVTSNNPQRHYEWAKGFDPSTASQDELDALLRRSIEPFIRGANGKDRNPFTNGAMAVAEIGEEGTFHLHHFFCSQTPARFSSLQRKYFRSNIVPVRGNVEDVMDYIHKRGKHSDKKETQLTDPIRWGEYLTDNKGSSRSPVFTDIENLLDQGLTPREIYNLSSKFAFYRAAIETTYAARLEKDIPAKRELKVVWHFGESGTGKSNTYYQLCEEHGADNVYFVTGQYKNIFDQYNYETVLFLDEVREQSIPFSNLLSLLDVYPVTLRCRYADKKLAATEIHITSVYPPEKLYHLFDEHERINQLLRRITTIVYHWKEESPSGSNLFKTAAIKGEDYRGEKSLIEFAIAHSEGKDPMKPNLK